MNNPDARKALIKQIHILKHNLALDEDLYRTALESITGKRSAALCSEAELRKAVMILRFRRRQDPRLKKLYSRAKAVLGDDYKTRLGRFCVDRLGRHPDALDDSGFKAAHAFLSALEGKS